MTLKVGDRVRRETRRPTHYDSGNFEGFEGTVTGPYNGAFNYAVKIKWDKPGPPESHVIEDYLVKIDDVPDEVEGFFV